MLWIKEVEMVESVDDLKSSCSVRGIQMPNSHLKSQSGGAKGPERGPFPSLKTDCLLDLRILLGHWGQ